MRWETDEILKPPYGAILHKPIHFKVPEIDIHLRIDHVLRHAIEQFVRRNRLDDSAFVLRAVVAERCTTIKCASQRNAAARYGGSNCAKHKRPPANDRSKFVTALADFQCRQKLKSRDERSLEQKHAKRETHEGDQARGINRQANIACA